MNSASVKETRVIPTVSVEEFYRRLDATGICRISSRSARSNADAKFYKCPKCERFYDGNSCNECVGNGGKDKETEKPREIPVTPGKPYSDYLDAHNGDYYEAAKEFYKTELQGGKVTAQLGDLGEQEVHFTGRNLKKIQQNMKIDPVKAELVQHVPDIIKTGEFLGDIPAHKEHFPYVNFYYLTKRVKTSAGEKEVIVDIGRRNDGVFEYSLYSLNHDGFKTYAVKKAYIQAYLAGKKKMRE